MSLLFVYFSSHRADDLGWHTPAADLFSDLIAVRSLSHLDGEHLLRSKARILLLLQMVLPRRVKALGHRRELNKHRTKVGRRERERERKKRLSSFCFFSASISSVSRCSVQRR